MKRISVLIKPASSLCNIKCRYCFYNDISSIREVKSFGKMTVQLAEKMIEQIYVDLEDGDFLDLAFQGGEPTLAGLSYYKSLIQKISQQSKKVTVSYAIQTNGIINDKWCAFFKENNFLVGLSIDGPAIFHNSERVDWKQRGTYQRVKKTKDLFDTYKIDYNVLTVLTNQIASNPNEMITYLKKEAIKYIQFIPCLDALLEDNHHKYALNPEQFAYFYKKIYKWWLEELKVQNYVSIKLFDDLFHFLVNQQVTACGMNGRCQTQYVIEADGSVYPCDFYVLDEYKLGNIKENTLKELFSQPINLNFMCQRRKAKEQCKKCLYQNVCGGGCKRMEEAIYVNNSDTYCGFQDFLSMYIDGLPNVKTYLTGINV